MQNENIEDSSLVDEKHTEPLIFDKEALFRRTQNNEELVRRLIVIYQDEMSKSLNELRKYVEMRDYDSINSYAHNIKGASSNMGCMLLSSTAKEMQDAAAECDYNITFGLLSEMEQQYAIVLDYIKGV